jgi:outer membrane protein assembly factor BamE (lipoprotein component of BamABCDE complex)
MTQRFSWRDLIPCAVAVCIYFGMVGASFVGYVYSLNQGPAIGCPPEQHMVTIQEGMTKDEVRSLLGEPTYTGGSGEDDWTYKCSPGGGALFTVCFGLDERVSRHYWWLD